MNAFLERLFGSTKSARKNSEKTKSVVPDRYEIIGRGMDMGRPYEVGIHWYDDESDSIFAPISMSVGGGQMDNGCNIPLRDVLELHWSKELTVCDCLWLRDLALEEKNRAERVTPDEIFARRQSRETNLESLNG